MQDASETQSDELGPFSALNAVLRKGCIWTMALLLIATGVVVGLFAYIWLTFSIFPGIKPRPFDSAAWKAWSIEAMREAQGRHDYDTSELRQAMYPDLVARHKLQGLHVSEIKGLLGEPDNQFLPEEWGDPGDWHLAYPLGMDWVDYQVLALRLDDSDRVDGFKVVTY